MEPALSRRRKWFVIGPVVVALGIAAAVVTRDDEAARAVGAGPVLDRADIARDGNGVEDPLLTSDPAPPGPPAATPEAAAAAFFDAEAAADFTTSYGLLSAADRGAVGGPLEWAAAHDELPTFVTFSADGSAERREDEAIVRGSLQMQPLVDEVAGIVPARARVEVVTVPEDGGWRVAFADTNIEPLHPDPEGAVGAAQAWIERRVECDATRSGYDGTLLGDPRIEAALCGLTEPFAARGPVELDEIPDLTPFLTSFGPDGIEALRAVAFDGPAPLTVVLAPLGDDWVVVGAE